jgi:hypothetical protein
MVRAGVRSKVVALATLVLFVLGCGGSDAAVAPIGPPQVRHLTIAVRYIFRLTPNEEHIITAAADRWAPYPVLSFRGDARVGERVALVNDVFAPRTRLIVRPAIAR